MTQFEDVLETILEEYARRDSEGEFDTWEETDAFVKEKAEVLLAYVKEESVCEELEKVADQYSQGIESDYTNDMFDRGDIYEAIIYGAQWQKRKDEYITEDLGEYINELSKQFPEVSFAKLSRIAVRVAKWKEEHDK